MSGKPGRSGPPGHRRREVHGFSTLRRAVRELGDRAVDGRTRVGRALLAWREDLVADLGGTDALSTQRALLVDVIVRQKLLLDSVDAWLLSRAESLVDDEKRALLPVLVQRQALADGLARYLSTIGLDRAKPEPASFRDYIETKYGARATEAGGGPA